MKEIVFSDLAKKSMDQLVALCQDINVDVLEGRDVILYEIIKKYCIDGYDIIYTGILETSGSYGFLRDINRSFHPGAYDVYVHKKFLIGFRTGDEIQCLITIPGDDFKKKTFIIKKILNKITSKKRFFEDGIAQYPKQRIKLEINKSLGLNYHIISRCIDLICPIGFGQRMLIAASPKSGKTTILHSMAISILNNYKNDPKVKLIILLLGERPEEVTEMKKIAEGAIIISSTFDEVPEKQIKSAEIATEMAKRFSW